MSYTKIKVYLSDGQISKLKSAVQKCEEVTLQINQSKPPNYDIFLTKTQINQINNGKRITISKTQLKKKGGFLPFLAPLLPAILAGTKALATGAATALGAYGTKKAIEKLSGKGIYHPFETKKGLGCKKKRSGKVK